MFTFRRVRTNLTTLPKPDNVIHNVESDESTVSSENDSKCGAFYSKELYLLDLYAGCGALSTGLTMGASYSGVNLKTKWAVDINKSACSSLKLNHPETEVRN